jgi:RNA polymerase sigma factor (sigma-70 family)
LVHIYLNQIGGHQVLDREQERVLGRDIMLGQQAQAVLNRPDGGPHGGRARRRLLDQVTAGQAAARQMVLHNLKLVVSVSKHYSRQDYPLMDAVQDGTIGLFLAVQRYDWRRPTKFATMARWWITQAIQRARADQALSPRLPSHQWDRLRSVHSVADWLTSQNGQQPALEDIVKYTRGTPAGTQQLLDLERGAISLDQPVTPDSTTELHELVPAPGVANFEETVVVMMLVDQALRYLKPVPAAVANLRFVQGVSREDTAATLGLTMSELANIEGRAKTELRSKLDDYHTSRSR